MNTGRKCNFCDSGEKIESSDGSPSSGQIYNLFHTSVLAVSCADGQEIRFPNMKYCPVCGRSLLSRKERTRRGPRKYFYLGQSIYEKDGIDEENEIIILAENDDAALKKYHECVARTPLIRAVSDPQIAKLINAVDLIQDQFSSDDIRELEAYGSVAYRW